MIPYQFLPLLVAYWPHMLMGLFLYTMWFLVKDKNREAHEHELEKAQMRIAERTRKGMAEESEEEDFSAGPVVPEGEEVAMVAFDGPKFKEEEMTKRSEEFLKFSNKRRTVREYSNRPVPREVIENIVKTAGTAPSGAHTEPWTFVVVADKSVKEEIRRIVEEEEEMNYKKRMGEKWVEDLAKFKTTWVKPYLTECPYIVLLFKQTYGLNEDGSKKTHYYNEISCSVAAGLFIAATHNAGLSTLTSTPMNCGPALRTLLDRPKNEKLLFLLPVGYAAEDAKVPKLERKGIDDGLMVMFD